METFLFALGGYLVGSIPVAYLLTRKRNGIDLRKEGSGNIGARNAYEVTGNKRLGVVVLLLDMHKGIIPLVILSKIGFCGMIPYVAVTIVLGHCYPIWLKFHGGRGLATGAAIAILVSPVTFICWILVYFLSGLLKKQVQLQSLLATITSILFVLVTNNSPSVYTRRFICLEDEYVFQFSAIAILCIILSRHVQPVYELFRRAKA
ncbi:MAG: glycerol-3-phosphate acyltransferase [Candidatus Kapaibacterium sp.]